MRKLQVLFPEGTMRRLRDVARRDDRPMSEIVRRATEDWLESQPTGPAWDGPVPVYDLGIRISDPGTMKELIYVREEPKDYGGGFGAGPETEHPSGKEPRPS